jgi:GTP cyclohydrolase II
MVVTNRTKPVDEYSVESDAMLPTESGNFRVRVTVDEDGNEHSLLYTGLDSSAIPLIRIHSECLTGDAFGSLKCDCGPQLKHAMDRIQEEGCGAIVYLRQEGRGIGLHAKIKAYALQDHGLDTLDANLALGLPADSRDYKIAADMLLEMGIEEVRLMTNNPGKINGLKHNGIRISERVPHITGVGDNNRHYLETKGKRMGHLL